ncbi:unnamed protein product [Lactuca virosa]|uniref:Uncharacterized protein n=1 Tax=Lactuca virosa TaxID=75947 RepID=A0AAU9NZ33_9ASTR|nr:unnamed protein product [Lactuca virosa]
MDFSIFSTYMSLVLFWAEIYHQARSLPADKLRPAYFIVNGAIYFLQISIWIYMRFSLVGVEIAELLLSEATKEADHVDLRSKMLTIFIPLLVDEVYNELADRCGVPRLAKKLNQILVKHIKTVLPGLKARISAALVSVAKEHASYGEITESKVGMGALLLNILSKYSEDDLHDFFKQPFLQRLRVKTKRCQHLSCQEEQEYTIFSSQYLSKVWRKLTLVRT